MTLTPTDVQTWTNITVSQTQLDAFGQAAEAKLNADGGYAITGSSRNQLLSYLVAGYVDAASGTFGTQSESIGNYSYTKRSSAGTSIWIDLYTETLASLLSAASRIASSGESSLVTRVDKECMNMNRRFPRSAERIV